MPRVYLINIGANASHPLKSPLFADGTFELLPIPERVRMPGVQVSSAQPPLVRYSDLTQHSDLSDHLLAFIPKTYHQRPCHFDPEFVTRTYGDDPRRAPRAAALRSAQRGDLLLFLARLWAWEPAGFSGKSGFYLVAVLEMESVLRDVRQHPAQEDMATYGANAHIRRALADPTYWDGFWVFKGSSLSHRFPQAIELTPELASQLLRDKREQPWVWRPDRTSLQTIGSYTRTIRCVADTESTAFQEWPGELRKELGY
ncbi:MAG TPA: hypothetical protein VJM51_00025 [Dehalococcoidia bacterium]|nr:hypothetical protein [Dehalococcoidia bacterium]